MPSIGVDFGARRIGVAVSHSDVLATPHSVVRNDGNLERVIESVARIAAEIEASTIVLGIPRSTRRDAEHTTRRYEELAERIRQRTCKEVVLWDESLTTVEAAQKLREAGRPDSSIDMHAAAVILQSWLDDRARRRP